MPDLLPITDRPHPPSHTPQAGQHAVPLPQDGGGHQGWRGTAAHAPTDRRQRPPQAHRHLHRPLRPPVQVGSWTLCKGWMLTCLRERSVTLSACSLCLCPQLPAHRGSAGAGPARFRRCQQGWQQLLRLQRCAQGGAAGSLHRHPARLVGWQGSHREAVACAC